MATINAKTTHTIKKKKSSLGVKKATKGATARRGSIAPPLKPATLSSRAAIQQLRSQDAANRKKAVTELFRRALGEQSGGLKNIAAPHAASTTRDRAAAAADVAIAARELGVCFVLKECGCVDEMQRMLFPQGIETFLSRLSENNETQSIRPSVSAVSLTSLEETATFTTIHSGGTDSKRGKTTPANAREGSLLVIRALCEIAGRKAEPFLVGAFLAAALDECGSNSSAIRQAAEDTATALVSLAHPWAFPSIICPLLLQSLDASEWRIKANALERLEQCARGTATGQVEKLIPTLIPAITNQVWDTKAQVAKAARSSLLAICKTNTNSDIKPTIPAVVNAICKPADTNKAVSELMGTTFVVPVGASTLAILCPVLARALKEKLAIHKRAACVVISNMSKLVETPDDIAPFGSLLVPELQNVSKNVQFEEIRDEALKALANLTKALGESYKEAEDVGHAQEMEGEKVRVEAEQEQIKEAREAEAKREEELREKEEAERKKFKEAMDAQRELDILAAKEADKKRKEEESRREKLKLTTKGATGKCQSCGLKRCKKTCMFYSGK